MMTIVTAGRLIHDHLDRAIACALQAPSEQFVNLWDDGFDPCGWQRQDSTPAQAERPPQDVEPHLCAANDNLGLRVLIRQ